MSQAFESFYRNQFGDEWEALKRALSVKGRRVARPVNRDRIEDSVLARISELEFDAENSEVQALLDANPNSFYVMDWASQLIAEWIPIKAGAIVWDACAAPGGKSLILWERLKNQGKLTATDLSKTRCFKMKTMVKGFLGEIPESMEIITADALKWGYTKQERYDTVLLDAPCSSEQHVLLDPRALAEWSVARTKSLAKRQYGLLCSAVLASKKGGSIGYGTCSVNEGENDSVIERYLKKKGDVETQKIALPIGRRTEFGWMIRPDLDEGWGPIYFSLLRRL
jgi:16S rRNA C967 or C1407 C5-methylase (RsmB/RsmF family)